MESRGSTDGVDDVAKDSPRDGIQEHNFAEEFPSELPSVATSSSAPSGSSSPYASSQVPSATKVDDRDVVAQHGGSAVSDVKKLDHAPPSEPMSSTGLAMIDSLERPLAVSATRNHEVTPGAFPVVPSSRNTATSHQTLRSRPTTPYDSIRELTNEEAKQDDRVPNSGGVSAGSNESTREATESGLYAVEAQLVPDGNDDGTTIVAEAQEHLTPLKWYQRRWITLGSILFACVLVVVVVVVVVRPQSASSSSSLTSRPTVPMIEAPPTRAPTAKSPSTSKPTSVLTSELVACNFLSIPDVTRCRSTFAFDSYWNGNRTTGSTIPSEIGLLTNLTYLDFPPPIS